MFPFNGFVHDSIPSNAKSKVKNHLKRLSLSFFLLLLGQNWNIMYRIVLILALIVSLPLAGNAQRKRAFLVGISKYHTNGRTAWTNIHGKEDIDLLTPALKEKGFEVSSVVNEEATYQGIVSALTAFINDTKKKDVVYLHFSCHGQPVEDGLKGDSLDEEDHWDESVVPIDAGRLYDVNGYKGEKHLTDDELNGYIKTLRTKIGPKGMLYVAMDACHAGEMSRKGLETVRGTNEALSSKSDSKYNPPRTNIKHYSIEKSNNLAPALFLEACQSRERNTEVRINRKEYGALSYNVWQALEAMPTFGTNAQEFKAKVEESTKQEGRWPRTQTLVTESSF